MAKSDKILISFLSSLSKKKKQFLWEMLMFMSLLGTFAALSEDLIHGKLKLFDTIIGEWIYRFTEPGVTTAAVWITTLGSAFVEVPLLLGTVAWLLFRSKKHWQAVMLAISLSGSELLNLFLKEIFHRSRPTLPHLVEAGGYSFPSGHAMAAASFYGMLGYCIWRSRQKQGKCSWPLPAFTGMLIFLIGLSRVYLRVHFPSDVIAGFGAGGAWLIICIMVWQTIDNHSHS
ncbi:phosphatase PAP2 family protein [Thermoactinomyces daqus]|jgi:undecaprenyl-diphosphatase|uniref:Phosphatase PAP2 family protein n=1 Tax=Thermoactinomyces daqus TaxID=1329516 RepID=A0A7W2AI60_9BACL|nr:phosphatase PAP2 family protein [Thermoactinomyces daqus]MBA4543466.1 phosphatase PAP2 family protein [Thermoactinomyces daqus]